MPDVPLDSGWPWPATWSIPLSAKELGVGVPFKFGFGEKASIDDEEVGHYDE